MRKMTKRIERKYIGLYATLEILFVFLFGFMWPPAIFLVGSVYLFNYGIIGESGFEDYEQRE